jgi:hypothetical protein
MSKKGTNRKRGASYEAESQLCREDWSRGD